MSAALRRWCWRMVFAATGGFAVEGSWPRGSYVVVANHTTHADAPALLAAMPARTRARTAAAEDYWFRRPFRRCLCRVAAGGFAIRRSGGGSADLGVAIGLLRCGHSVVVFPEGTRSRDGGLGRFRGGAVRMAAAADVPVVPVALLGTATLLPTHGRPRRAPIVVRVGSPLTRPSAEEARAAVAKLLGSPPARVDSRVRRRVAAFAASGPALALVVSWAFAEAVSWPLVPEFALGLLVLARVPWRRAAALASAALVGSTAGCLLTAGLAASGHPAPAPWTTPRMRAVALTQLRHAGASGVLHQPWSGIPVKVYAAAAGRAHLSAGPFAVAVAAARGVRLIVVTLLIGTIARLLPPRVYVPVAVFAVATFAVGLHRVVQHWS
jgi:1-acyl-sn-glycerol-3-phosphate acyltransferase